MKNVIIGSLAADGIHCEASCTIENMYSSHVGEDAVTLLDGSPTSSVVTIQGGGVQHAYDKVVQMDGAGTVRISHFAASDIGSLVRSCGNCPHQYPRHMVVSDVFIDGGRYKVAGVNQNFGDTAKLDHITIRGTRMQVATGPSVAAARPPRRYPEGAETPTRGCATSATPPSCSSTDEVVRSVTPKPWPARRLVNGRSSPRSTAS